jgi:hypothetical protein
MELPFNNIEREKELGYLPVFLSGIVGGISFIISYGSGLLLKIIIFGRHQ